MLGKTLITPQTGSSGKKCKWCFLGWENLFKKITISIISFG
jgi:hypothetical protein